MTKHIPKYAVVIESDFNDNISDMFEIETVDGRYDFKETIKYGIHRARYYMYKFEEPTTLYVFELGKYKETKKAIFSATWFGPIYW